MSEWRPIETAPRGRRKVILLIADTSPNGYGTDPWTGWLDSAGEAVRWPYRFPPTHWMEIPELPKGERSIT